MPYIKKADKKQLILLLEQIENDWNWKKVERNNNSWGDCMVYEDDYVKLDSRWKEVAQNLKSKLK